MLQERMDMVSTCYIDRLLTHRLVSGSQEAAPLRRADLFCPYGSHAERGNSPGRSPVHKKDRRAVKTGSHGVSSPMCYIA